MFQPSLKTYFFVSFHKYSAYKLIYIIIILLFPVPNAQTSFQFPPNSFFCNSKQKMRDLNH